MARTLRRGDPLSAEVRRCLTQSLLGNGERRVGWSSAGRELRSGRPLLLGLMDRVDEYFALVPPPTPDEITNAFWCACHGGQRAVAEYLLGRGADLNWIGHDGYSPLDVANRSGASEVVQWLRSRGAKSAKESTVG